MPATPPLRLVPPAASTPKQRSAKRVRATAHGDALVCGCGGTQFVVLLAGPVLVGGRVQGGTKRYACAACWVAGRLAVIA